MQFPATRRGRPRSAPEDSATRERLMDVAQQLFARHGYDSVTMRALTAEAGVNLAAVNYWFGSKDALLHALVLRAGRAIQASRRALLKAALSATARSQATRVREILHALLAPAVALPSDESSAFLYGTLLARARHGGPPELSDLFVRQTSHLDPFIAALSQALPGLSHTELIWRLHFVLNIEHAVHTEVDRLAHMSNGLCATDNRAALLERILDFVLPGMLAAPRATAASDRPAASSDLPKAARPRRQKSVP